MKYYCPFCLNEKELEERRYINKERETFAYSTLPRPDEYRSLFGYIFFANMLRCHKKRCMDLTKWALETHSSNFQLAIPSTLESFNYKPSRDLRWIYEEKDKHLLEKLNIYIISAYLFNKARGQESVNKKAKRLMTAKDTGKEQLKNGKYRAKCALCGKSFITKWTHTLYCSAECSKQVKNARKEESKKRKRIYTRGPYHTKNSTK